MENSKVYQSSNSFQEKEVDNSDAVFKDVLDSIISAVCSSSSLNQKSSESILVSSFGVSSGDDNKMLNAKHQSYDSSHKLKILPSEECQSNFNILYEDCKVMENKSTFEESGEIFESQTVISKNSASEKSCMLKEGPEDFNANLPEMKTVEKELMLETKAMGKESLKNVYLVEDVESANGNLKDIISEECNRLKELPAEIDSDREAERKAFDINEIVEEPDKNDTLSGKMTNEDDGLSEIPNEDAAFSNYLDIKIPRIGRHVFQNEERPLTNCYDLAVERNERRFNNMKETGMDNEILRLVDEEANMSENDKKKNKIRKQQENIETACYITELCSKILEELVKESIDEKKIIYYLMKFLGANVTPTCLLYVPHLVHTISFIRGKRCFKKETRLAADECYNYCHAMFPIPFGCNFETVYTSEMRKFLPDGFDKLESLSLDYGDIDDILEKSDDDNDKSDDDNSDNYSLL